jgi:hypothetical protein
MPESTVDAIPGDAAVKPPVYVDPALPRLACFPHEMLGV